MFDTSKVTASTGNIFGELKAAWGPVTAGQEPWAGIRTKQLQVSEWRFLPTAMAYCKSTGDCLVVVKRPGGYLFTHWVGANPALLESSLKGEVPYKEMLLSGAGINGLSVPSGEVDIHTAARAFVTWCGKQTR